MLCVYELYDLHMLLVAIRTYPENCVNFDVVTKILYVLNNRFECDEINQFRKSLQSVKSIDEYSIYDFVFTENNYCYHPLPFLKDESVYSILISSFKEMLVVINEQNREKIVDLADCLHDLPIILANNHYSVPKSFWQLNVKYYRNQWNENFLVEEQKIQKGFSKLIRKLKT